MRNPIAWGEPRLPLASTTETKSSVGPSMGKTRKIVKGEGDDPSHRLEKRCVANGLRMTDQRRTIARVLSVATDHPDVEELYRRASGVDPRISIATVYRTVKLFEDAGILERHDFRDGRARYEEVTDTHHDHLIDLETGKVVEFHNQEIEALKKRIAEELGFKLVDHRLELYGIPLSGRKPEAERTEVGHPKVERGETAVSNGLGEGSEAVSPEASEAGKS